MTVSPYVTLATLAFILVSCGATHIWTPEEYDKKYPDNVPSVITSTPPWEYLSLDEIPDNVDWRDLNGTNYVTPIRNQHIPKYCGSCWAHATSSALSDRLKIMHKAQNPEIVLAQQFLLNYDHCGTCEGGFHPCVYEWLHYNYMPDDTCISYVAEDEKEEPINMCRNCDENGKCWAVEEFPKYAVGDYGTVTGAEQMIPEIYARGPIACGMYVSDKFMEYKSGIYSEYQKYPIMNHIVSVVGFGLEESTGTKYWIVRNSWGTYWGEKGFFRIVMGDVHQNLGIEFLCAWGVPKVLSP